MALYGQQAHLVLDLLLDLRDHSATPAARATIDRLVPMRDHTTGRRAGDHWLCVARLALFALEFEALSNRVGALGVNHAE